jgi:hypothetical protein
LDALLDWLLEGPVWIQYRALVDLAHEPESSPDVRADDPGMTEMVAG